MPNNLHAPPTAANQTDLNTIDIDIDIDIGADADAGQSAKTRAITST